jgi:Fic family protein
MKMPEKPRDPNEIIKDNGDFFNLWQTEEARGLVKQYNEEYVHWDDLRRKSLPINPEIIWAMMKMSRYTQLKQIEILDITLSYTLTNDAQRIIHILDKGAGGLVILEKPMEPLDMQRYVISSLMEEAIASSQIEGAVTTTKEAKRMLREGRKPRTPSEKMIFNDYITMQKLKELKEKPLTIDTILELHRSITNDTLEDKKDEGRFRTEDDVVVADILEGKIYYHPPSHVKIQSCIQKLCDFANEDKKNADFQHPLIKAIIVHFMIGYVHPFVDGNGRLARALMYWLALKKNYWLFEYMAVSKVIKNRKGKYGLAYLYAETDENDITYFINYNLNCMERALENTRQYIIKKQTEQRKAMILIDAHSELSYRQAEILKEMIKHKGEPFTIQEVATEFNVAYQTARTDLLFLMEKGFIAMKKVRKRFIFTYIKISTTEENQP